MNQNTAATFRAACLQVLSIFDDLESVDIAALDGEATFSRFQNLKGRGLKPRSLQDYRRRFLVAVASYRSYIADPSSWKAPGQERQARSDANGSQRSRAAERDKGTQNSSDGAELVVYPFPVRGGITAQIKLPRDLTTMEARRLVAFIMSLAVDSEAGGFPVLLAGREDRPSRG